MAEPTLDTLDIHSTDLYVERGYPWKEWDLLRGLFYGVGLGMLLYNLFLWFSFRENALLWIGRLK